MKRWIRQVISATLSLSMVSSLISPAMAANEAASSSSYFDFEASAYQVDENTKELTIKVLRHGDGMQAATVTYSVADFLSSYGEDYVVIGPTGSPLEKIYGLKPDADDFSPVEEATEPETPVEQPSTDTGTEPETPVEQPSTDAGAEPETPVEQPSTDASAEPETPVEQPSTDAGAEPETPVEQPSTDTGTEPETPVEQPSTDVDTLPEARAEQPSTDAGNEPETPVEQPSTDAGTEPETPVEQPSTDAGTEPETEAAASEEETAASSKKAVSTGSSLMDAANSYLGITQSEQAADIENDATEILKDFYEYFLTAEGARGELYFGAGETEKSITIRVYDNDVSDGDKLFLLALTGCDGENTTIMPSASTYVTIVDDEEYETPEYTILAENTSLTAENPECNVTVRKNSGTQYFSQAYVSTVQQTASEADYVPFSMQTVSFAPGETEKVIPVTALDFSSYKTFGVRLESDDSGTVANHYVEFEILPEGSNTLSAASAAPEPLDTKVYLGTSQILKDISSGEWSSKTTGSDKSNYAYVANGNGYVGQYDKNDYSMIYTKSPINTYGVKNIRYSFSTGGDGSKFTTYFEIDSDQTFAGSVASNSYSGKQGWAERNLNVSDKSGSFYIKFAVKANAIGKNNPRATLDWYRLDYAAYTFAPQNSLENFNRKIYDFTQPDANGHYPSIIETHYDKSDSQDSDSETINNNADSLEYNPGTVKITSSSQEITGFYGNNTKSVTIEDVNATANSAKGITLKGVYFSTKSANKMYAAGKYTTSESYYLSAKNGKVTFTPDQNFLRTLANSGAISDTSQDTTINIYPVYQQSTVSVNFENTDRNDYIASEKGKYDKDHMASYIANILESYEDGFAKKHVYNGWLDYYQIVVPKDSIIRVQTVPISSKIANGVSYWFWGKDPKQTYYKAGDTIASDEADGITLNKTDYTKADIVATGNMSVKPCTSIQTMEIRYADPDAIPTLPGSSDPISLEDAVVITDTLTDETPIGTDQKGFLSWDNPLTGMHFSMTALPPEGYFVEWVDMTGDTNHDGYIDEQEKAAGRHNGQSMPENVYGNQLAGQLMTDNFQIYYLFSPISSSGGHKTKTGVIYRDTSTFYELANHISSAKPGEPVSGAYINYGGVTTQTDTNGKFTADAAHLPLAGNVTTSITTQDGQQYYALSELKMHTAITLPAISKFTPESASASYENSLYQDSISKAYITVQDDTLSLSARVSANSTLLPTSAKFYVVNEAGNVKIDCAENSAYEITTTKYGTDLVATLSFNPKQDMESGDRIYVEFFDQSGVTSGRIDLGYTFFALLDMKSFIFPLIGSSALEDFYNEGVIADLIGDPLGDIDLASIDGFQIKSDNYTPSGVPESLADKYTYNLQSYTFGWSKEFGDKSSDDKPSEGGDGSTSQDSSPLPEDTSAMQELPGNSSYSTKGGYQWSITPSVGFRLQVSNRTKGADLSTPYFEDLTFYLKADFDVEANQTITLPIGLSILLSAGLGGNVTGIYRMYVNYGTIYENNPLIPYTSEDFGLFKKFDNSEIERTAYIFLDPTVSIGLGVGYGILSVNGDAEFEFNMDFQFTSADQYAYGTMDINMGWSIELASFTVYSKKYDDVHTQKLFSKNADEGFDYQPFSLMQEDTDPLISNEISSRDYLANRTPWMAANTALLSAAENTVETTLQSGAGTNPQMSLTKINETESLLIFVGDSQDRTDVNRRTLYYAIGTDAGFGQPQAVHDDGTLDDYPSVLDLGDQILITWSSAEQVLDETATAEDALKSLNIQAAFFDKTTKQLGTTENVTKTTDEDYAADLFPYAAYDSATDKLILYYTKTEYQNLETLSDLSTAASVNAYLFYDMANDQWCNTGSEYDDSELPGLTDEQKETYREQWYGQRFLDLRINQNDAQLPRVVDTSAISYNGLGVFAWTIDWDRDLTTVNDRDVFFQIYNFSENSFTHIIRATKDSGAYVLPKLVRSENATYLFYGVQDESTGEGQIVYFNISDIISNNMFTKVTENGASYYELKTIAPEITDVPEPGGSTSTIASKEVYLTPNMATTIGNLTEFDVLVDNDGEMYVVWTDMAESAREIFVSSYSVTDTDISGDITESDTSDTQTSDDTDAFWSSPYQLTNAGGTTFYNGIGATVLDGKLCITAGKGDYDNQALADFVLISHTPGSEIVVSDLTVDAVHPTAGDIVTATVTLYNDGLLTGGANTAVTFSVNGEEAATETLTSNISGASTQTVSAALTIPEADSVTITATANGTSDSVTLENKALPAGENCTIDSYDELYSEDNCMATATLTNNGNLPTGDVTLTLSTGDTVLTQQSVQGLGIGEVREVSLLANIPDEAFTMVEDTGKADVTFTAAADGETFFTETATVMKAFDLEAITLLEQVTGITFQNNGVYTVESLSETEIQPTISGVGKDSMMVQWLESSNESVATIGYSNEINAYDAGTATITGIVVPATERITINNYGFAEAIDWQDVIPADQQIFVTAEVQVQQSSTGSDSSSGGTSTPGTTTTEDGTTIKVENTADGSTVTTTTAPDGSSTTETVTADGTITVDAVLTEQALENTPVSLPMNPTNASAKPVISVSLPEGTDKATIVVPVSDITPGVVAAVIGSNGEKTILPFSIPVEDGLLLTVSNGTTFVVEDYSRSFIDVAKDAWYADSVAFTTARGLFNGTSDTTFGPNQPMTRAMLMTVLARLDGCDTTTGTTWYEAGMAWAMENGISDGTLPHNNITREQLVTMLYRYFGQPDVTGNLAAFQDADQVSDWAVDAMIWAVDIGLITGIGDGILAPDAPAQRAQVSTILMRYLTYTMKGESVS